MCCSGFLKMMMFIFNGGIFVAGAAVLGLGIWVKVDMDSLLGAFGDLEGVDLSQLAAVSYILIAAGVFLVVIGFLGCCGAVKESRCMLMTFFVIVLIIFLGQLAMAILLLVFKDLAGDLLGSLRTEVAEALETHYGDDPNLTSIWDTAMDELKCCGYSNYTDFTGSPFNDKDLLYPDPCCSGTTNGTCSEAIAQSSNINGCYDKLVEFIESNAAIVGGVALAIVAVEIAAMVVSMVLYKDIGKRG